MDVRLYTDEKYVPINELQAFGDEFINETKNYRRMFMEVIQLGDLDFVNIVETPALIKKRFIKNIELKGILNINVENNDYILAIAKAIAKGEDVEGVNIPHASKLREIYLQNGKDLTIITNYLTEKINDVVVKTTSNEIEKVMPELSKNEVQFIKKFNGRNLNYSINDFQEQNKTSYETARKSLDKLSELKLYIKQKIGKKFVYSPTDKLLILMKGGE